MVQHKKKRYRQQFNTATAVSANVIRSLVICFESQGSAGNEPRKTVARPVCTRCARCGCCAGYNVPLDLEDRITSKNFGFAWLPRSSNLTAPDFFRRGFLKDRAKVKKPQNV